MTACGANRVLWLRKGEPRRCASAKNSLMIEQATAAEIDEVFATTAEIVDDRRRSFRCAVHEADEAGMLRTRFSDVLVRIVEKSAGGFGVVAPLAPPIKSGTLLTLATPNGCHEVRVAHIVQLGNERRIGLERMRELSFRSGKHGLPSRFGWPLILGLCAVCFACGTIIPAFWNESYGTRLASPNLDSEAIESQYASWTAPEREKRLAEGFIKLDGFKDQTLVEALHLSPQQQTKINSIVADASSRLAVIYAQKDSGPAGIWSDVGLQLVHRSYDKIEHELTAEQKARWADLVKSPSQGK